MSARTLALPILALAVFGCDSGTERANAAPDIRQSRSSTRPGERVIAPADWDTVFRLGGTESDTLLYRPAYVEALDSDVFLYDSGRSQVGRLSSSGDPLWWFGGRGRGPDEFTHVRDIERDADGNLWLLDVSNVRITVLTPEGEVARRIPLGDLAHPEKVLPVGDGRATLLTLDTSTPLIVIDDRGLPVKRIAHPWKAWGTLSPLASQSVAAADAGTGRFALAFAAGNGFFVFEGDRALPYFGTYVEHVDFPRIVVTGNRRSQKTTLDRPVFSAQSIDLEGDRLYVLFAGRSEHSSRVIDIYEATTGSYVKSVALPRSVFEFAVADGVVYGLYHNPYPTLAAWSSPELD